MKKTLFAAMAVISLATVAIFASVTFDPATGMGFVGKGDVQLALGLNNAQMQATNPLNLTFTYSTVDTYQVVNAWASGNEDNPVSLNYHTATVTTSVGVNSSVLFDPRQKNGQKQWTGFNLNGFTPGSTIVDGTVPVASPTVQFVAFTWDEQVWTGEWNWYACGTNRDGSIKYCKGDKIYNTVTHTTDQLPAYFDENGNLQLYTEGNNKAVLSVSLLDSTGGLYINGKLLQ